MKIKRLILLFGLLLIVFLTTSCNGKTLINEVVNRYVEYDEHISILDFEDAIVEASLIAKESNVRIKYSSSNMIIGTSGFGSGVIINQEEISKNMYRYTVLTNRHVVLTSSNNSKKVTISFGEDEEYLASIVKVDSSQDIAIISFESPRILSVAKVATSSAQVGRFVISVGNPYNVDKYYDSITVGNVSYVNREIEEKDMYGEEITNIYIQHTSPINGGNSGGGLFNIKGELIGINTWKIANEDVEGMGFAIPIQNIYNKYKEYFK